MAEPPETTFSALQDVFSANYAAAKQWRMKDSNRISGSLKRRV
jgi:hypothetical protein